jgi:class 3 adenylate cyclase/pSer/pThr/pTyr-binding forkhead associated (FHA) protein
MKTEDFAKFQELYKRKEELEQELEKFKTPVTVCFVDIVGSTRYFEQRGDYAGMIYVHACIDRLIPECEKHGGTICKTIGDAIMAYFTDPAEGVRAAIDMQLSLEEFNKGKPDHDQMHVRIGLNYGRGVVKDKDVFGDVVNTSARIEAAAKGDQIFISADLEGVVKEAKFSVQKMPPLAAKGKEQPVNVFEVLWKKDTAGKPISAVRTPSPTIAGRTPVMEAAKPVASGTVVLSPAAIADLLKRQAVQYSLVIVRPDGTHGQAYKIEKAESVLGRVEGDITFPDDGLVSRRHAKLTQTENGLFVEDLNSANGVYRRLKEPHTLKHGEVILMGRQMFRFYAQSPGSDSGGGKDAKTPAPGTAKGAELVRILQGGVEENHYPLPPGESVLGRTRGTINFADDAYLSSRHARILNESGKCVLEDLQAVNGTFVGIREKTLVADGDIILLGHQLLRVTTTAP